jgi:hypothetical protein
MGDNKGRCAAERGEGMKEERGRREFTKGNKRLFLRLCRDEVQYGGSVKVRTPHSLSHSLRAASKPPARRRTSSATQPTISLSIIFLSARTEKNQFQDVFYPQEFVHPTSLFRCPSSCEWNEKFSVSIGESARSPHGVHPHTATRFSDGEKRSLGTPAVNREYGTDGEPSRKRR